MNQRFPNYRPSTALSQAITLYRDAQKRRAEAEASAPGKLGGPSGGGVAPGREGTDTGATGEGSRRDQAGEPGYADNSALASGRQSDE